MNSTCAVEPDRVASLGARAASLLAGEAVALDNSIDPNRWPVAAVKAIEPFRQPNGWGASRRLALAVEPAPCVESPPSAASPLSVVNRWWVAQQAAGALRCPYAV